ncbi:MAG: hypothetical protein PHD03_03815 [Bacilli bacterium]|nr:hypothetical protein [Bacilli bacterium]MDD4407219.1 hypothetical protein [Bacilli bacterium]
MKNKKIIVIGLIVIGLIAFAFTYDKMVRKIHLITVPYSKAEILKYLEKHYNEKFAIKNEITLDKGTKDKVYIAYPINNKTVKFYVYDEYVGGYIGLGDSKGPLRELKDTYTNALLLKDLPNLQSIYPDLSVKEYNINYEFFVANLRSGSYMQDITLSFNNSYHDVDNVANKFIEIFNYVKDNISKYKTAHTKIRIDILGVSAQIDGDFPNIQDIKENITDYLIHKYRENDNNALFDIPPNIKEKYPVKNIGWGNLLTKVYVNGELFGIKQYDKVKAIYNNGNLKFDGIDVLIPGLKTHLKLVDYNSFNNLIKIEETIIFAYEIDNNIYILTQGKREGVSIYKYENSDVNFIKDGWESMSSQELNKYFGIKTSYDFEKEILNIEY